MINISKLILLMCLPIIGYTQTSTMKTITKNGMTVNHEYHRDSLSIELSAPTSGWITIGFNEQADLKGSLLIMCRIVNGQVEVVEHSTISSGNYKPIASLGGANSITNIKGKKHNGITTISFDLPTNAIDKYHKELSEGSTYYVTLAYSQSTDFQHHSIMRTNIKSIL